MRRLFLLATILFVATKGVAEDEVKTALHSWSAFRGVDPKPLTVGQCVTRNNSSMGFARGISAQVSYLLAAPVEICAELLVTTDPSKHTEPDVYQQRSFQTEAAAEFGTLKFDRKVAAIGRLLEAMKKPDELLLTDRERESLRNTGGKVEPRTFWANLLRERWSRLASLGDLGGVSGYDVRGEIASLLREEPEIARRFATLLAPVAQPAAPVSPAVYYWDNSKVHDTAALELGAMFWLEIEGRRQVLDVTYYASSGYLASLTLFDFVPVTVGGQPRTFVYEACLVSSLEVIGGFGLKRKIAASLLAREMEDSIRQFQTDAVASAAGHH